MSRNTDPKLQVGLIPSKEIALADLRARLGGDNHKDDVAEVYSQLLVDAANVGDLDAAYWIDTLRRRGASLRVLQEIEQVVRNVERTLSPTLIKSQKRIVWGTKSIGPLHDNDTVWALRIMTVIEHDFVNRLGRCALRDCRKYFVGDPRSKWCSTTCGSHYRVTKKRNPAKARRMI